MHDQPWTPEQDDILRTMRAGRATRAEIAERLGRSVTGVAHRIDKIGLANPTFRWTPAADAELRRMRELVPPMGFRAIGAELGCTRNAAIGRAHRVGIIGHGYGTRARRAPTPKPERRKYNLVVENMRRKRATKK